MLIMTDGGVGATDDSLDFWREHRSKFGRFVEAWGYLSEDDALRDGRSFFASTRKYAHPDTPRLVLIDEYGAEMWLTGCCVGYGGTGPGGTETILVEEGFGPQPQIWDLVSNHVVLGLRKGAAQPLEAVPNEIRGNRRNRERLHRWMCRLWHEPRIHTDKELRDAARLLKSHRDPLHGAPAGRGGLQDRAA